jgi:hypothetical protein
MRSVQAHVERDCGEGAAGHDQSVRSIVAHEVSKAGVVSRARSEMALRCATRKSVPR